MSTAPPQSSWRFCIAPMMKYTDTNYRFFARLLSKNARLYTEMVVAPAITKGDKQRFLRREPEESPVALQLGGSDPRELATAAAIGEQHGFDEINLNIGCPSDRVQAGEFGACLMAKPELVARCVSEIKQKVSIPVTVKSRIGIDEQDSYDFLKQFVQRIYDGGADALIVHARKAILSGLSPAENRSIPPLHYDTVYSLVDDFSSLPIVINGGIQNLEHSQEHLAKCHGVMLGRAATANPFLLSQVDRQLFKDSQSPVSRDEILAHYLTFVQRYWQSGRSKQMMIKPLYGLYLGCPGAKQWRRNLNAAIHEPRPPELDSLLVHSSPYEISAP
ncbi:MAG: tRNA dihydrouridine(20/20a) synthase DusA [Pseudomonadota bacterium]